MPRISNLSIYCIYFFYLCWVSVRIENQNPLFIAVRNIKTLQDFLCEFRCFWIDFGVFVMTHLTGFCYDGGIVDFRIHRAMACCTMRPFTLFYKGFIAFTVCEVLQDIGM